jgi:hypothetical protein
MTSTPNNFGIALECEGLPSLFNKARQSAGDSDPPNGPRVLKSESKLSHSKAGQQRVNVKVQRTNTVFTRFEKRRQAFALQSYAH